MAGVTAIGLGIPAALAGLALVHDVTAASLELVLLLAVFALDLLAVGLLVAHASAVQALRAGGHRAVELTTRAAFAATLGLGLVLAGAVVAGGPH